MLLRPGLRAGAFLCLVSFVRDLPAFYTSPCMDLHIGTSGWGLRELEAGIPFRKSCRPKRFLEFYGTRLNAVELNATFRRMPTESAIAGWLGATPEDFRFAAKVHQSITHFKRVKGL